MNWKSKQLWIGLALAVIVAVGAYTWFSGKSGVSEELGGSLGVGLGGTGVQQTSGSVNIGNQVGGQTVGQITQDPDLHLGGCPTYTAETCPRDECELKTITRRTEIVQECIAKPEVQNDTTPPTISITAPSANQSVSGIITISATARDNETAIAQVEFFIDGERKTVDTSSPYSMSWNTTQLTVAPHKIKVEAIDTMNNVASAERTVTVTPATAAPVNNVSGRLPDTTPPVVRITAPPRDAIVTGNVAVTAEATDDSGIASVRFSIDGELKKTMIPPMPFSMVWDTTGETNTFHRIEASATDKAGEISLTFLRTVTVANTGSHPDPAPPEQPGQLPAAIATVAAAETPNTDATAIPGQTDIDLGSFTLAANADATKFSTLELTKTGSTPNAAITKIAVKKADGSTLVFLQNLNAAGKGRFTFAETTLSATPQTFKLTATLAGNALPETNFTFSLQAQSSLAGQAQDVTLGGTFALRRISIPAATVTPEQTAQELSALAGRPTRNADTNPTAGEVKDVAVLEITFTNGQPLEPIAIDGLTLEFSGNLPVTKLSEPVFYSGATGRPLPASQATVTRDPRNGDIAAEFSNVEVDVQTSLILYVKVSTNSADVDKTIQYTIGNIEVDADVEVDIENAGSPTFTVQSATSTVADAQRQAEATRLAAEEASKAEAVRKSAEEAKKAAEEAKQALEEARKTLAKSAKTPAVPAKNSTPIDRQLADAQAASAPAPGAQGTPASASSAPQPNASTAQRAAASSGELEGSQRLTRAPERGNTGPGVGIYFAILGVVQAGRLIRKQLKKK